jgi:hypothetical protein
MIPHAASALATTVGALVVAVVSDERVRDV